MEALGIVTIPAIMVICYLFGEIAKASSMDNKWIPIICGVSGCMLGILAMFLMPDYPANDYITAAAIGIASGLAATGANQILKQLKSGDGHEGD